MTRMKVWACNREWIGLIYISCNSGVGYIDYGAAGQAWMKFIHSIQVYHLYIPTPSTANCLTSK